MNPATETKLRRIERFSSLLRGVCAALTVPTAALSLFLAGAVWLSRNGHLQYLDQSIAMDDLTNAGRVIVSALALASGAVVITALVQLRRLLGNYARREIFTADSARQLRNFGVSCMLWGILKVGWAFLPLVTLSHGAQPVRLQSDTIMIGLALVLLSWFAEMAAELREENDLTI